MIFLSPDRDKNICVATHKSDSAYVAVRNLVTGFIFVPGQRIFVKYLSEYLGISTTPLREALFALERDGYVERNKNDAFHATKIDTKYVRELFEYGTILYKYGAPHRASPSREINKKYNYIRWFRQVEIINIALIYKCAHENIRNNFISRQSEIFINKTAAVRDALQGADEDFFRHVYCKSSYDDFEISSITSIIDAVHITKSKNADRIARAIFSYAANKSAVHGITV